MNAAPTVGGASPPAWRSLLLICALAALAWSGTTMASAAAPKPVAPASGPSYLLYTTAHGLWTIRTDGGAPRLIAHGLARPTARLSTDGRYLLYAFPSSLTVAGHSAAVGWRELFLCRADGSGARVVAVLPASTFGSRFAWSADDTHVLYVRVGVTARPAQGEGAPAWPWEIRAVDLTSGKATTIWTGHLNNFSPVPLGWRRDLGRAYVVDSVSGGLSTRYEAIDTATSQIAEVKLKGTATADVVASPHQYYTAVAQGLDRQQGTLVGLYPISSPRSGVTSVTLAHDRVVAPLYWSLVGGNLAYTTSDATPRASGAAASRATGAQAAGVRFHVLSLLLGRDRVVGSDGLNSDVLGWSPDGRWLLIRHATNRGRTLYLLAADGSGKRRAVLVDTSLLTVAEGFAGWGTWGTSG